MSKVLVTGASGHLGRKTLLQLLKRKPADGLVALVRDPEKAKDLAAKFVDDKSLNPLLAKILKGEPPKSMKEVAERYGKLFSETEFFA